MFRRTALKYMMSSVKCKAEIKIIVKNDVPDVDTLFPVPSTMYPIPYSLYPVPCIGGITL